MGTSTTAASRATPLASAAAAAAAASTGPTIDITTILSLLSVVVILGAAYSVSLQYLGPRTSMKIRVLFIWHLFDAMIHCFLEGGFLFNCFFTWIEIPKTPRSSSSGSFWGRSNTPQHAAAERAAMEMVRLTPPDVYWLGDKERLYGSAYGTNPLAMLWREYAKADKRWGGTDLGIISLEILTVFIGAPLALYICKLIVDSEGSKVGKVEYKKWFWMVILATGELYGGFMTFAPEWLTGSPNLDTSNWMYLWLYLFFFNFLWVAIPVWIIYEAYCTFTRAMTHEQVVDIIANLPKKGQ